MTIKKKIDNALSKIPYDIPLIGKTNELEAFWKSIVEYTGEPHLKFKQAIDEQREHEITRKRLYDQ